MLQPEKGQRYDYDDEPAPLVERTVRTASQGMLSCGMGRFHGASDRLQCSGVEYESIVGVVSTPDGCANFRKWISGLGAVRPGVRLRVRAELALELVRAGPSRRGTPNGRPLCSATGAL